ncbi:dephospho-CoA kinase [Helicobacter cetorum]|uniref:Dephospho-CoA kinase n=1 Tax=Helicobacter cetorum (strain ATCC BAA-429 / MIT 00-7128) TaxID=182217 RepID=I0EP34_HELC0|nr:dephospho-CoA kinase [Helicobacter cetorum]AFI04703.1 dephospho-CoA kinase [Helicobacter cetorum MIT 00-7128]
MEFALKNAIALTGGIGTGKSTTARLLELHGYKVLDADKIAHKLLGENQLEIAKYFGEEILENNTLNRKKLGAIVFNDKTKLEWLEKFLHPLIREMMLKEALLLDALNKPYFLDIPLFFEVGGKSSYPIKSVLLVYAPRALQIKRVLERDKLKEVEILQRLECQMDIEKKRSLSDYVIDNSATLKELQYYLERFLETL